MSLACIIEREPIQKRQIEIALKEIDEKLTVLSFDDLEGFYQWFNALLKKEDAEAKKEDLKLIVGDIEFLGPRYFSLIEKLRKLMVRRGLIAKEDDLAVILTTFEAPDLNFKQIESRTITNVIFKPFDKPILKQHLQVALAQQKAIKEYMIYNQKLKTTAEMLKEVQLESYSELGFVTRSNRELQVNAVSKYYNRHFETAGKANVIARCLSCAPHPTVPGEFQAEFRYLGLNNQQVKKLRQSLFAADLDHAHSKSNPVDKRIFPKKNRTSSTAELHFLMFINEETENSLEIKDAIEQSLVGIEVHLNRTMAKFLEALTKNDLTVLGSKPINAIFLNIAHFNPAKGVDTWKRIQSQCEEFNKKLAIKDPKPKLFLISPRDLLDTEMRDWAAVFDDVIMLPIDRPYLSKRLMTLYTEASPRRENIDLASSKTDEIIRVANPIELTTISEACLTMKYYRPISFHSFRRFFLPSANVTELNELLAACYFVEKKDNVYINHFVFFGITDKYLKYIRKWILERYIASKDGAG